MKLCQALGLGLELAPGAGVEALERLQLHPALLVAPGPRHPTVDKEGGYGLRGLGAEHLRPVPLGQDLGATGVDEQRRVPDRQQAGRCRRLPIRKRLARKMSSSASIV